MLIVVKTLSGECNRGLNEEELHYSVPQLPGGPQRRLLLQAGVHRKPQVLFQQRSPHYCPVRYKWAKWSEAQMATCGPSLSNSVVQISNLKSVVKSSGCV